MKRFFIFTVSTLCISGLSWVGKPARASDEKSDKFEKEIKESEARRFRAMTELDIPALDRLLADDLTYTHSSGRTDTKTSFLESLRSGELKYESISPENILIRVFGDTAVVTGQGGMKVSSRGSELSFQVRFLDVYVKRSGRWQMVAWQSTRMAP